MSNVVEPVSPMASSSVLGSVQSKVESIWSSLQSFLPKRTTEVAPLTSLEDSSYCPSTLTDSAVDTQQLIRRNSSKSLFFSFLTSNPEKTQKQRKRREPVVKKEIGINTIPILVWRKLEALCILRLSKHLALVYLYTLLSELSKVRELRKFWQSHNYTPWYQRHRTLYLKSQDHINNLISIETYVVRLCGQLHEQMLTVEDLEPIGRWIEGDGSLVEAISQWGVNSVQWELFGTMSNSFNLPLDSYGSCYSGLQEYTTETCTLANAVETLACLHVLHRSPQEDGKTSGINTIPMSLLRRHIIALTREEDRVVIARELQRHESSSAKKLAVSPTVQVIDDEDEDVFDMLPSEAYLFAFKYTKCGGEHIPDEGNLCECTFPAYVERILNESQTDPRFRMRRLCISKSLGSGSLPSNVGIADLFSYTVVRSKIVKAGEDGVKMQEKELRAQLMRRCMDSLHFDELWTPGFEQEELQPDQVAIYIHAPLSMILAPLPDSLLEFPKPSMISLSPLLSIVNLCRHWFPQFPVNMLQVINSRRATPKVICDQQPLYMTHLAEHQVKFTQSIAEFKTPSFTSRHFELMLGFMTVCGISIYQAYTHQDVVEEAFTDVKESAQEFYREHVDEPIRNISKRIFRAFFEKTKNNPDITRAEVYESKLELAKMLRNFGMQFADDISNSEKITKDVFLKQLDSRAQKCDMSIVMHKYTADIQKPFTSAAQGSLLSGILIQVQKLKVDGEEAILDMDQIIEQNEINFNLAAALPAVFLVLSLMYMANSVADNIIRRGRSKGYLQRELRETLHKIESLLITGETRNADENTQFDHNYLVHACTNTTGCTCPQMNVYQRHESRRRKPVNKPNKPAHSRPGPTTPGLERHPSHISVSRKNVRLDDGFDAPTPDDERRLPILTPGSPTPRSSSICLSLESPEKLSILSRDYCPIHGITGYVNVLWRKEDTKYDQFNQYDELYVNPFKLHLQDKGEDRLGVRDDGYVLLYCTVMEELTQKLPKHMRKTVIEPLLRSISSLKSSEYNLHQKLMIVEHMYRAYDFFTYKL